MLKKQIDHDLLKRFEKGLDPRYPQKNTIPAKILGYGEMSTIFEIDQETQRGLAYKRMPIFHTQQEMDQYEQIYQEYNYLLNDEVGIHVPEFTSVRIAPEKGNLIIYNVQRKLPKESICNSLLHSLDQESMKSLMLAVLREFKKVWAFNKKSTGIEIGIDGQISNWAVKDYTSGKNLAGQNIELYYIDTSTPLYKKNGVEQLNPELFLRSAPSFLVWLVKWLFLEDVMTRYYDFHLVVVDLIANFYKEQRPGYIPLLIDTANTFFSREAKEFSVSPITLKEVRAYYREDAMIWRIYLAFRKVDRFIHNRILHKPYVYILPGKIKR
ncbi:MAG: hypothetical protein JW920_06310 [Deltaproteobacteria bacterium]|nr:hypothetical protein [Deltaproteobacteria bacterium]